MNFGSVVRYALNSSELPMDATHLELAKNDGNLIIQNLWYQVKADFRQSRGTLTTISGSDEYVLNKYFDQYIKNTMQGPQNWPISFQYLDTLEFFRKVQLQSGTSGNQFVYTFGDMVGYDAQLLGASRIKVFSSLASKTVGLVNVIAGDDRVKSTTAIFTTNDVGLRFRKSSDSKTYKIGKYISPFEVQLNEKYRGTTGLSQNYAIGDVGVRVNISGFVGGQITSEDVELDGDNQITTQMTFNSLVSISKTDLTGGGITTTDINGITVGTMAPGETEIERQTILFWPKPGDSQEIHYRFFMHHPVLWLDSDRILIPKKWHRLIAYKLTARLLEQTNQAVPAGLSANIDKIERQFEDDANDGTLMDSVPDSDDQRTRGESFYYNKFPSL